jgi:hypothetical protein
LFHFYFAEFSAARFRQGPRGIAVLNLKPRSASRSRSKILYAYNIRACELYLRMLNCTQGSRPSPWGLRLRGGAEEICLYGTVDRDLPGPRDRANGVRLQPVRRLNARPPRPQIARPLNERRLGCRGTSNPAALKPERKRLTLLACCATIPRDG